MFDAFDSLAFAGQEIGIVEAIHEGFIKYLENKGALAGTRNAGDADKDPEWNCNVYVLEIEFRSTDYLNEFPRFAPVFRQRNLQLAAQVFAGNG